MTQVAKEIKRISKVYVKADELLHSGDEIGFHTTLLEGAQDATDLMLQEKEAFEKKFIAYEKDSNVLDSEIAEMSTILKKQLSDFAKH